MRVYARCVAIPILLSIGLGIGTPLSAQLATRATYVDDGSFQLPPAGSNSPLDPVALGVAPDGAVHVVDENGQIFVFDPMGEADGAYGAGHLGEPIAIAFDDRGSAYVIDRDPNRIQVFKADREWWYTVGASRRGGARLQDPVDLAVGPNGYVHVLDESGPAVRVFGRDGVFIRAINLPPQVDDPIGLAVDGDGAILITTKKVPGTVFQLPPFSATPWLARGQPAGLVIGASGEPNAMVSDGRGTVIVLDGRERRLFGGQRVDPDGALLSRPIYGGQGTGRGSFRRPVDVAFTGERDLLILDRELRKVERISLSAEERVVDMVAEYPIRVSLLPPDLTGAVVAVRDIGGGATRLVRVSEPTRSVNVRQRAGGAFTDFFGHQFRAMSIAEGAETEGPAFTFRNAPADVALNDTLLVVAHPREDGFAVFDLRDGSSLGMYGSGYEDDRRLDEPRGVAIFPDGNIAVADHRNDRVAVFSADLASLVGSFMFPQVEGVAVSRSGELYAWDESGLRIAQLPPQGAPIQVSSQLVPGPVTDIAFDAAGNLFLLESETSRVTVINAAKDRVFVRFGGRDPEFEAAHISVDDVGNVYLASTERDATHTYRWDLNLPPLTDLVVTLTGEGAGLTWSPIQSEFLAGYNILGAASNDGDFTALSSTTEATATVTTGPDDPIRWIRVTPTTVAGTAAAGSDPVPLYHLNAIAASEAGEYGMVVGVMERLDEVLAQGTLEVEPSLWQELQWRALEAEAELGYYEEAAAREPALSGWTGEDGGFTLHRRLAEVHWELGNASSVLEHATAALDLMDEDDVTGQVGLPLLRMAVEAAFNLGAYQRVLGLGETLRPHATADEEYRLITRLASSRLEVDQPAMALRMADELVEREAAGGVVSYGSDRNELAWVGLQSAIDLGDAEAVSRWRPLVEPVVQGDRLQEFQILIGGFELRYGDVEAATATLLSLITPGDPDVIGNPAVVELSFGIYRVLQDADSTAHRAGLDFLEGYAGQLPDALADLREAYADSLEAFSAREATRVRLGGAFQAWRDADLFGLVEFLEDVLAQGTLTVDEEVLARALLAGAYLDTGRADEARSELVRVLGFQPGYDAGEANAEAEAFYGVTPFNATLIGLLEQVRNQGRP